jgi:uncharacterized protein (DUF2236 family)
MFGPASVSWRVHQETTVLFGGARALLMQAAHPLVIAGARATGFYQRNPWKRLERTLQLAYTITFGTRDEAAAAAEAINDVHRRVRGIDEVTGRPYDAFDPDLLLWVHACLVDSALLFEELTVGALTTREREQFHHEQMIAAEMLGLPRDRVPPTVPALRAYIDMMVESGELLVGESAQQVAATIVHPPAEAEWKPILKAISFWAFGTLPPRLRAAYGVRWTPAHELGLRASLRFLKTVRPGIPRRYRVIQPAAHAASRAG